MHKKILGYGGAYAVFDFGHTVTDKQKINRSRLESLHCMHGMYTVFNMSCAVGNKQRIYCFDILLSAAIFLCSLA